MANQIITNICNADCEFCFAADSRSRMLRMDAVQMAESEMRSYLDFTRRAGIRELRLLGGEPTLHPDFADFVKLGREEGFSIMVFTNGCMPDEALEVLASLAPDVCTVVVNLNAALGEQARKRRRNALALLGQRVTLGMTLTSADFSLRYAMELIGRFGLRKLIRIGLAHPTWGGKNRSLHPKRYSAVGQALFGQSFLTAGCGIELEADCGFVRCMFGRNFAQLQANGFHYSSQCTPVVDLCTGGTILPCFALSNLMQANLKDFENSKSVYKFFNEKLRPWHSFGIFPECSQCQFFETEECCGGCLAARLRRIQPMMGEAQEVSPDAAAQPAHQDCTPVRD
ncbi:MAG: radical SAM protein [Flexilinea sp.]|nr:radical SAM protein [Flexilinea sp.]